MDEVNLVDKRIEIKNIQTFLYPTFSGSYGFAGSHYLVEADGVTGALHIESPPGVIAKQEDLLKPLIHRGKWITIGYGSLMVAVALLLPYGLLARTLTVGILGIVFLGLLFGLTLRDK